MFLHLISCFLWMIFDEGCSKTLEMLYCHEFIFNWHGISRVWSCLIVYMKELRSVENKTHRVCMSFEFFGFITEVFAFLWYFLEIVDFLMRILEFESAHFVEYKNSYDFLKLAVLLKPLFQHRCEFWLQTSKFCSWYLNWIFLPYIWSIFGTSPSGIMLKSSSNN